MPLPPTIGSQALPAQLQRSALALRAEVQRHSQEMTTGRTADTARHLRGNLGALGVLESRMARIAAQTPALAAATQAAEAAQAGLARLAERGNAVWTGLLPLGTGEPAPEALARAGQAARAGLDDMLSAVAAETAGRALFAGTQSGRAPLPGAGVLMAGIASLVTGAASAEEIAARVDQAFDDPAGLFASLYAGGDPLPLGPEGAALPTAADPGVKGMLRHAVLGALLADTAAVPGLDTRRGLAGLAIARYPAAAERLTDTQARLGDAEARLAGARTRLSAEGDALERARSDLIGADPYEAAGRLDEARARLEALYVVTARVARLSLTEYLR